MREFLFADFMVAKVGVAVYREGAIWGLDCVSNMSDFGKRYSVLIYLEF